MPTTLHQFDRVYLALSINQVIECTLLSIDVKATTATIQPQKAATLDAQSRKWESAPLHPDCAATRALKARFMPDGRYRGIITVDLAHVFDDLNEARHYQANRFMQFGASPLGQEGHWIVQDLRDRKSYTFVRGRDLPAGPRLEYVIKDASMAMQKK